MLLNNTFIIRMKQTNERQPFVIILFYAWWGHEKQKRHNQQKPKMEIHYSVGYLDMNYIINISANAVVHEKWNADRIV